MKRAQQLLALSLVILASSVMLHGVDDKSNLKKARIYAACAVGLVLSNSLSFMQYNDNCTFEDLTIREQLYVKFGYPPDTHQARLTKACDPNADLKDGYTVSSLLGALGCTIQTFRYLRLACNS